MPETSPNPQLTARPDKVGARRLRDLALLARADQARRCVHVKTNGLRCGSPAMRGNPFCFFHDRWYNQPAEDTFPPLEDQNSVQLALMQVVERLRRQTFRKGEIDSRLIKPLVFALKVAALNARHTSFDSVGFRDKFVTVRPVERIPDRELAPADAGKPPRSERELEGEAQARNG